jgi:hypothetical protein
MTNVRSVRRMSVLHDGSDSAQPLHGLSPCKAASHMTPVHSLSSTIDSESQAALRLHHSGAGRFRAFLAAAVGVFQLARRLQGADEQQVYTPNDFLLKSKLANVNCLEMVKSLQADYLVMKLAGFAESLVNAPSQTDAPCLRDALGQGSQGAGDSELVCS